ncbi:MAG TPA: aminoacyl-tRNA hydrolase, partial [Clostridiales bacterium]|nr:aminoacyl-tRNA hydrolase [Clostridiales bacterium]
NPGRQYERSRHNAGFMAAAALEAEKGVKINRAKFRSLTALADLEGARVLLMKPQTYMNL